MYPYYGQTMGWGGIVMMTLGMIVFWSTLGVVAIMLLRRADTARHDSAALRILQERLAKGEIDTEEFDHVRKTLLTR
jgi:putative membrane protein